MNILVSGASGLIGAALRKRLREKGHPVGALVRSERRSDGEADEVFWDPLAGGVDRAGLEDRDAVVHLAGENLASGYWTAAVRKRIFDSRVKGTGLLATALAGLKRPPRIFACASAVGFYGNRGDEILDESSGTGRGFLAEVCREWERAAEPARQAGIRVVHLRFGMVLDREKGALPRMLPVFRAGLGGRLGNGDQYMSWVALSDAVRAVEFALESDGVEGPVNVTAPNPVTNADFARSLGRALSRPALLGLPAFAARLVLGEMAEELLLASCRARPSRLLEAGFEFRYPELGPALRAVLEAGPS